MATQPISDVNVGSQDLGTGLGDNVDPNSAGLLPLMGAGFGLRAFVVANYAEGFGFVSRDGSADTVTVGTGLAFVVDDAAISPTADDGQTYRNGDVAIQPAQTGTKPYDYAHELAGDIVYAVEASSQTTVDVSSGQSNQIWLNITDLTSNNKVEIRSDGGGGATAEPSDTYLLLGTANPDGSASGDTRPNDYLSPVLRALEVRGDITDDQGNTYVDYANGWVPSAALEANSLTVTAGSDLTGGGSITLGNSATVDFDRASFLVDSPNGHIPNAVLDNGESAEITVPVPDGETLTVYRWGAYKVSDGTTPTDLDVELKDGSDTVQATANTGNTENTSGVASQTNSSGSLSIFKLAVANDTDSTISDPGVAAFFGYEVA